MKNADMPAMPVTMTEFTQGGREYAQEYEGLTKREEILARFMAAMLSNSDMRYDPEGLADDADSYVDAYFNKLERTK